MKSSKMAAIISRLLALTAVIFVSTASYWVLYRPETPTELKK
jgi:cyclic lactone autoinducer peptide